MGAGQSTETSDSPEGSGKPDQGSDLSGVVTNDMDFYALLGVEKGATDDELKRAYKKQALKLHPDRNFNRVEEATALFAKVQAAYDVLSDPQERAWYDSHGLSGPDEGEDQGHDSPENVTSSEDLKKYFDPMLYQNWTDEPDCTYQLAGNLFRRLGEEEEEAALEQGIRKDFDLLPEFGNSTSPWNDEAKLFYDAWLSFSSKKDFAWYDVYRLRDAPDRKTRRAMENMNQKSRDAARKEFNETIRALVAFVRKRDPRFKAHSKLSGGTKRRNEKASTAASKAQARRARQANMDAKKNYSQQEWETGATEDFDEFLSEDELELRNRQKEKEWKQRRAMRKNGDDVSSEGSEDDSEVEDVLQIFECVVCSKSFKTKKQLVAHEKSKKHMKAFQKLKWEMKKDGIDVSLHVSEEDKEDKEDEDEENGTVQSDADLDSSESKRVNGTKVSQHSDSQDSEQEENRFTNELVTNLEKTKISKSQSIPKMNQNDFNDSTSGDQKESTKSGPRIGKAKQKRMMRAQKTNSTPSLSCVVCNQTFPSRNKLFDHVKNSGHAVAPSSVKRK